MAAQPNQKAPNSYPGPFGERFFKAFICHGCQTCWELVDDGTPDGTVIQHRHILSLEDITDQVLADKEKAGMYDGLCK